MEKANGQEDKEWVEVRRVKDERKEKKISQGIEMVPVVVLVFNINLFFGFCSVGSGAPTSPPLFSPSPKGSTLFLFCLNFLPSNAMIHKSKSSKNTYSQILGSKRKVSFLKDRSSSRSFTAFTQHIYKPRQNPHPSMQRAA